MGCFGVVLRMLQVEGYVRVGLYVPLSHPWVGVSTCLYIVPAIAVHSRTSSILVTAGDQGRIRKAGGLENRSTPTSLLSLRYAAYSPPPLLSPLSLHDDIFSTQHHTTHQRLHISQQWKTLFSSISSASMIFGRRPRCDVPAQTD